MVVVRMLPRSFMLPHKEKRGRTHLGSSKMGRLVDDCPAILMNDEYSGVWGEWTDNLGIVSDRRRSEKTCKSRHGCSSLERNSDKELNGEE